MTRFRPVVPALLVLAGPALAADPATRMGSFPDGETYAPPALHAPAQVSRYVVRTVDLADGKAAVDIPVTGGTRLLVWTIPVGSEDAVSASVQTPGGRTLQSAQTQDESGEMGRRSFVAPDLGLGGQGRQQVVWVEKPEPGRYVVDLEGAHAPAVTVVAAEPDSSLTLSSWIGPLSRRAGDPVFLRAELKDGSTPVAGGRVTARLASPEGRAGDAVELMDDGAHGDGAAHDGVYGASVAVLPGGAGFWTARFEAEASAGGRAFARTSSGGLMNEASGARLLTDSVVARVRPGIGLVVQARADVAVAGAYRLDAIVAGAAAADGTRPALAWAEATRTLAAGSQTIRLTVPADRIRGFGTSALRVDVRLLGLDTIGVAGQTAVDAR